MTHTPIRRRTLPQMLAAAWVIAMSPLAAAAGQDPQKPLQPAGGNTSVVVEQVENGAAFGAEFKFAQVAHHDAFLMGGYGGAIFDNALLIGGAGYWQVGDDDDFGEIGYGGLLVEWYALRTPSVALSARGLLGGGAANVGPDGHLDMHDDGGGPKSSQPPNGPSGAHGEDDQAFFVFEPQLNVTVRVAHGVAMVGGVGYRVIGAANGFEDQIQGFTGSFAIRFGGGGR